MYNTVKTKAIGSQKWRFENFENSGLFCFQYEGSGLKLSHFRKPKNKSENMFKETCHLRELSLQQMIQKYVQNCSS